jgi:hypothetical protein
MIVNVFTIDYYSNLKKLFRWFTEYCMLVKMLGMLERGTNLFNLIEASEVKSKSNSFQE